MQGRNKANEKCYGGDKKKPECSIHLQTFFTI